MKKTREQKNNGITLIALVITIIVLLILAGVTIATLTGDNGILTRASEASERTKQANAEEQVKLAVAASIGEDGKINYDDLNNELAKIEGLTYKGNPISDTNKIEGLPVDVVVDGYKVTINEDGSVSVENNETGGDIAGKYYKTDTDITVGGKPVSIPGGATISGIEGEYESVDEGIVIYITKGDTITDWNADTEPANGIKDVQEKYDQFVWVPVENVILDLTPSEGILTESNSAEIKTAVQNEIDAGRYPMAIKNGENYFGVLYDFREENEQVKISPNSLWGPLSTNNNEKEPYDSSYQEEYNIMVERVKENAGFWVGRYETSNMIDDDATNQIKIIKGTQQGLYSVTWNRMYAQQGNYANLVFGENSKITSSMIWGSQWDQILIWMREKENTINKTNGKYYVTNGLGMGNYNGDDDGWNERSEAPTGYQENYKVKNIYDMAGNMREWTLEYSNYARTVRRKCIHYRWCTGKS